MGLGIYLSFFLISSTILNLICRLSRWLLLKSDCGRSCLGRLQSVPNIIKLLCFDFTTQTALTYFLTLIFVFVQVICAFIIRTPVYHLDLKALPESLKGFRIAVLSDVHIGPSVAEWQLRRLVVATNTLEPDIVVLVGDISDGPFGPLKVSLPHCLWVTLNQCVL